MLPCKLCTNIGKKLRNFTFTNFSQKFCEINNYRGFLKPWLGFVAFRTYSVDSSESSSDEASDKGEGVREEVEELNKVLANLVRENRELEVCSHFQDTFKSQINEKTLIV